VVNQIEPLRKLLEVRKSLANLRSSLIGNDKLETLLQEIIHNQERLQQAGAEVGLAAEAKEI
jgi:type VI secretion system protein ImpB